MNTGPSKEKKGGRNRASGKWTLLSAIGGILCLLAIAGYMMILNNKDDSSANVKAMRIEIKQADALTGGKGTPEYNQKLQEKALEDAQKAEALQKSFVPPVIGKTTEDNQALLNAAKDEPARAAPPKQQEVQRERQAKPQGQQKDPADALRALMLKEMQEIAKKNEFGPQTSYTYIKPEEDEKETDARPVDGKGGDIADTIALPGLNIKPGDLLYAVNDIHLNSDGGNKVVRATVLSGEYKGYIALGNFARENESLMIEFTSLTSPSGTVHPIKAYAIDPTVPTANVASAVDNHILERWGGLIAASFIQGLGDATRNSGITSQNYSTTGISGGLVTSTPEYSLMEKGVIAMGTVGDRASQVLMQKFNRPPTVELYAGQQIAILIIKSKI